MVAPSPSPSPDFAPGPDAADATAETILVALDGSPFAESALRHARAVARATGAPLHLVTVLDPVRSGSTSSSSAECRLQMIETERYLERLVHGLEEDGFEASREAREGNPADEIVAAALERDAGLVVVAARPRRPEERLVSRGVAQGIIASGAVSLLVARGNRTARTRRPGVSAYRRIAVGVDGSPDSHRALEMAASVAASEGAELVLIHVFPGSEASAEGRETVRRRKVVARRDFSEPSAAGSYLHELEQRLPTSDGEVRTVLCRSAEVADTVEDAAREARSELLVLGARGAGRASSRYGRCARRLLLRSEMPVLVVRGRERKTGELGARGDLRKDRGHGHIRRGRGDEAPSDPGAPRPTSEERIRR